MQRIISNPDTMIDDMLDGFVKANSHLVKRVTYESANTRGVVAAKYAPIPGKVGIVTGGGSGHKPAFIGYVGKNMCDAAAVGEIFSSPTALAFLEAFRAADGGAGVACLYGNYSGDNMNVKMAVRAAQREGIQVKTVVANDDVASAPRNQADKRRGVAGEILMWKCAGAKAAAGASLDEVIQTAQKALRHTHSIGIGLTPCTLPGSNHPNFTIQDKTMEVGIGHHGEPGIEVCPLEDAAGMAKRMVSAVLPDEPFRQEDQVVVLLSGLGATPLMELYILFHEIENLLSQKGLMIHRAYVGNYFTSLDMKGATLTIMNTDEELRTLIDMEADCAGFRQ
ncbi:dihydroxyacetone kinase subunit DhaK [Diplocloster hominis]|uniref:dihydroxyacetone kinase subunit DhaK n=1 Tax=Diplocloster hominis TaxID=3079010 RepID=UPI0031BABD6A